MYELKDHLGNVRATIWPNGNGGITQTTQTNTTSYEELFHLNNISDPFGGPPASAYSGDFYISTAYDSPSSLKINEGEGYYEDYPVSAGDIMDFTVWYGNSYYTTDRANIKIEMIDNFGGSTILHNQGYYKNLYTNPATFASKSVNNIVAAYDGYFRVTLSCSKGVAYFENLDIDIDRTETVITNTIETDVLHSSDYYPFGLRMVKNSAPSTDYRYGYQGDFAEEDDETGFNHFQLRQYDPVIGRWLIPDPARQYHSPYLAFGNNPVNRVDPDGGTDGVINVNGGPCKCSQVVEGRQVTFNSKYLGNTDMTMNDFADMIAIINRRNEYSSLSWMYIEQHGESLVSGVGAMQVFDWVGHSHGQIEVGALFHVNPGGSFAKGFMGLATSLATYLGIPLDRNMYRETLILAPQPPNLIGEVDTVSDRITPGLFRKVHTKWLRTDGTFKDSISYPKPQVNWAQ